MAGAFKTTQIFTESCSNNSPTTVLIQEAYHLLSKVFASFLRDYETYKLYSFAFIVDYLYFWSSLGIIYYTLNYAKPTFCYVKNKLQKFRSFYSKECDNNNVYLSWKLICKFFASIALNDKPCFYVLISNTIVEL